MNENKIVHNTDYAIFMTNEQCQEKLFVDCGQSGRTIINGKVGGFWGNTIIGNGDTADKNNCII